MLVVDPLQSVFTHPVDVSALALFTALAVLERVRPARER
jgi:hypothetical protein